MEEDNTPLMKLTIMLVAIYAAYIWSEVTGVNIFDWLKIVLNAWM